MLKLERESRTREQLLEEGYIDVAALDDVPGMMPLAVDIGDTEVLLCRHRLKICAVSSICPHQDAPMDDGFIEAGAIVCPLHQFAFDLETGTCRTDDETPPLTRYEVTTRDGRVFVRLVALTMVALLMLVGCESPKTDSAQGTSEESGEEEGASEPSAKDKEAAEEKRHELERKARSINPTDPSTWPTEMRAFRLGHALSSASLGRGFGDDSDYVETNYSLAVLVGSDLELEVPELQSSKTSDVALDYVLSGGVRTVGMAIAKKYGPKHAALYDFMVRMNLLRLSYAPNDVQSDQQIVVLQQAAAIADIPEELVEPLVDRVNGNASLPNVAETIKELHKRIDEHLLERYVK